MKVKILRVFSLFFAAILLPAVFSCSDLSVSKQGGSLSFSIDSRDLFSQLDSHSSWSSVKLELALFGDYTAERAVSCSENDLKNADFPVKTVTFDGIPFDSSVYVKALLYGTYVEDGSEFISIDKMFYFLYFFKKIRPIIVYYVLFEKPNNSRTNYIKQEAAA